jgi:hypothetical protein
MELVAREYKYTARAILQRGLFRELKVEETDGGHIDPKPGEVVIYFYLQSNAIAGWYFRRANAPRTPIFFENGNPDFTSRIMFFLNSIERLAAQDQGNDAQPGVGPTAVR